MKNRAVGLLHVLLAAAVQLVLLPFGGAVVVHRSPPKKNLLGTLRAALESRTEELHNQQNIAHGLELEVRELQSELQAQKQVLAKETAKEEVLQMKLNKVRSVLNDDADGNTPPKASPSISSVGAPSSERGGATVVQDRIPSAAAEADPLINISQQAQSVAPLPVQTLEEPVREVQSQNETLESADTELESTEDAPTQQEQAPKAASTLPLAPVQQLSREQPSALKLATTLPQGIKPLVPARPARPPKPMAKRTATLKPPAPQLRASASSRPSSAVGDAGDSKGAEASADFDALEAQLHEEDRRIQDLDKENALDTMTDSGGVPPASASNHSYAKAVVTQPKLELDSPEASMEDFLNVEVPGPESASEAATSAPLDTLALPQAAETVAVNLDGALSDEKFLSQMATTVRH